jgi:cytosine/adenosine deaminase-related metal-dependent hydrolase
LEEKRSWGYIKNQDSSIQSIIRIFAYQNKAMRKLTADYIFTGSTKPIKGGTISVDDNGMILSVSTESEKDAEYFQGAICPGFVNVHTHLELSYAKNRIEKGGGIDQFIHKLEQLKRSVSEEEKQAAVSSAISEMRKQGVVAVGDIMNTKLSLAAKATSDLQFYNFVETYGSQAKDALQIWDGVFSLAAEVPEPKNIIPHAPYSLSRTLFQKIRDYQKPAHTLSMHHMESVGEAAFFVNGKGVLAERFKSWGLDLPMHIPTYQRPLASVGSFLQTSDRLLLIHNTFINKEDIDYAESNLSNTFYGLCPNANLFIEKALPPVDLLQAESLNICLGTDSLASNESLSILNEMKTLEQNFDIELQDLIQWATINGARALGMEGQMGSIEVGKNPGLVHIKDVDYDANCSLKHAQSELILV